MAGINIILSSITIFVSYGLIFSNIFHISSTEGMSKALSTCTSHMIAVSLFFGSMSFMCLSQTIFCWVHGWEKYLLCLLYQCGCYDEPLILQL